MKETLRKAEETSEHDGLEDSARSEPDFRARLALRSQSQPSHSLPQIARVSHGQKPLFQLAGAAAVPRRPPVPLARLLVVLLHQCAQAIHVAKQSLRQGIVILRRALQQSQSP